MFDVLIIYNLLKFKLKISLIENGPETIRFWLNLMGTSFSVLFLFITLVLVGSIDKQNIFGVSILLPFLLQLSINQRNYIDNGNINNRVGQNISVFLKTLNISFIDKTIFFLINQFILSIRFMFGIIFIIVLWLIFGKSNIIVFYSNILLYLISYVILNLILVLISITLVHNRIVSSFGYVFNLFLNIFSLIIFFSLFSLFNHNFKNNLILEFFEYFRNFQNILSVNLLMIMVVSLLFLFILLFFLRYYYENKSYYFINSQKHINFKSRRRFLSFYRLKFLNGVFGKDVKWLSKFPNLFLSILYPLIFIVFMTKFFNVNDDSIKPFRSFYLIIALSNLSFILDNQISIHSTYFLFDLTNELNIKLYFYSKFIISFLVFVFISLVFYFLNYELNLHYSLSINLVGAISFSFILLNIKGLFSSILDFKPMVYNEKQLKQLRNGLFSGCFLSVVNIFLLTPLFIFISLKPTYIIIIILNILAILIYIPCVYIAENIFKKRYFEITDTLVKSN